MESSSFVKWLESNWSYRFNMPLEVAGRRCLVKNIDYEPAETYLPRAIRHVDFVWLKEEGNAYALPLVFLNRNKLRFGNVVPLRHSVRVVSGAVVRVMNVDVPLYVNTSKRRLLVSDLASLAEEQGVTLNEPADTVLLKVVKTSKERRQTSEEWKEKTYR